MAGYSKEQERQNKVLGDLLSGREPEKRIMVGYEGQKKKQGEKKSALKKIMQEGRLPWFGPAWKQGRKKKLDDKMWRLFGHCFDCQIKIENKLRVEGKYEEWEKKKITENKKSFLHDLKQSIDEFENTGGKAEFFNSVGVRDVELEKEKWSMGEEKFNKLITDAREYIQSLEDEIEDEQQKTDST